MKASRSKPTDATTARTTTAALCRCRLRICKIITCPIWKLRVPVRMICPLFALAIGLQVVIHALKQRPDRRVADLYMLFRQRSRQMPESMRYPPL